MSQIIAADRDTWLRAGCQFQSQGHLVEALNCFEQAVRISPKDLQTLIQVGYSLIHLKEWRKAADVYERIVALLPKDHRVWCNLSFLYEHAGDLAKAEDRARKAIRLAPGSGEAWNNLGMALRGQHRIAEALQAFRQAIARQPELTLAEFNLATTYLLIGDGERGWPGYECRNTLPEAKLRVPIAPRWDGGPLAGGKLLVYSDQGLGDLIQFVRFLPEIKSRSQAAVILSSPAELLPVLAAVADADCVVRSEEEPREVAAEIAVASLPGLLHVDLGNVTSSVPYLTPPSMELPAPLRELLEKIPIGVLRVGLAWQGNPAQGHDYVRSVPLERLAPWAEVENVWWFSLQVNEAGRSQLANISSRWMMTDAGQHLRNFGDTAALMSQLDLVLTVDTSVAHLAGALGRPVWTMLGHTPDWRWRLTGTTCPWYPTMRLFRQPRRGDWDHVVHEIKQALVIESAAKARFPVGHVSNVPN